METSEQLKDRILRCMSAMKRDGFSQNNARVINKAAKALLSMTGETLSEGNWVKVR